MWDVGWQFGWGLRFASSPSHPPRLLLVRMAAVVVRPRPLEDFVIAVAA